jgi:hypothetical protein
MDTTHNETHQISIKVEGYDDIFSDFDARPYSKRSLSVDFLDEIKRASYDKSDEGIELAINVPRDKREKADEEVISDRLARHFQRHYQMLVQEKRGVIKNGSLMVILGVICMVAATFVLFEDPSHNLLLSFLIVFLEPAAWFLLWEGMDLIIFHSKNINKELDFYRKMSNCEINYVSYDEKIQAQLGVYYR